MEAGTVEKTMLKKQYKKWSNNEQKTLVSLWAERHEHLESKDVQVSKMKKSACKDKTYKNFGHG